MAARQIAFRLYDQFSKASRKGGSFYEIKAQQTVFNIPNLPIE